MREHFSFQGRIGRRDFQAARLGQGFLFILAMLALCVPLWFALAAFGVRQAVIAMLIMAVAFVLFVAFTVAQVALSVRRLHDIGRSGWWLGAPALAALLGILTSLIRYPPFLPQPLVLPVLVIPLGLVGIYVQFANGQSGPNRFGEPPPPETGTRAPIPTLTRAPKPALDAELTDTRRELDQAKTRLGR